MSAGSQQTLTGGQGQCLPTDRSFLMNAEKVYTCLWRNAKPAMLLIALVLLVCLLRHDSFMLSVETAAVKVLVEAK